MKKVRGYVLAVIGIVIIWVIFGKRIQEMMDNVRMPRIGNITQSRPTTSPITPTIQPPFAVSPPASTTVTPSRDPFSPVPTNPFMPTPQPFIPSHTPITPSTLPFVPSHTPITPSTLPFVQKTPITTSGIVDSINPITGGEVFTPIMWASTTSGMGGSQPSAGGGTGQVEIAW